MYLILLYRTLKNGKQWQILYNVYFTTVKNEQIQRMGGKEVETLQELLFQEVRSFKGSEKWDSNWQNTWD